MKKRTLYFNSSVYLSKWNNQLLIDYKNKEKNNITIPIEDIGFIFLDHYQITTTQGLMISLIEHDVGIIYCNSSHLPISLLLPMEGHSRQSAHFQLQQSISAVLKKKLWKQLIKAKLENQSLVLDSINKNGNRVRQWIKRLSADDTLTVEAGAAAYYWNNLFENHFPFIRDRNGLPPNDILNFGYSIMRSIIAKAIASAGLHPTIGLFHHNQYNAYCLADDLIEPYRCFVEKFTLDLIRENNYCAPALNKEIKYRLISLVNHKVLIDGEYSHIHSAAQKTASSLVQCFKRETNFILCPIFN